MPSSDISLGGDPPIANRFLFEVDGVQIGIFKEVMGLEVTVAAEEIKEGGQNGYLHKVPGRMTWPNIIFRRGLTDSDAFFDWMSKSSGEGFAGNQNTLKRSTGAITAITHTGERLRSWELQAVFPVRWKGPEFSITSQAPLEEELEITHHGFTSKTITHAAPPPAPSGQSGPAALPPPPSTPPPPPPDAPAPPDGSGGS